MTTFQYENGERLERLADRFFGEAGDIQKVPGIDSLKVYKYLLAYRIACKKNVNIKICEWLEERAIHLDLRKENRIFFEKVRMDVAVKDTIYFEDYMKKMEKDPGFLSEWYAYFEEVA